MSLAPLRPPRLPQLRDVPHALPYQGSKRALAHAIIPLIPAGASVLIEPFAGSAAITIAARHAGAASRAMISDIDQPLMDLWRRIITGPEDLADDYESLWRAQLADPRGYYELVRAAFNATREPHLLLYLLARCVKAAVRYSRAGEFNQSADHRRLGAAPDRMRARLVATSGTLTGTAAGTGDYRDLLLSAAPEAVVYLDPPYQGVSAVADHRYLRGLERGEFEVQLRAAIRHGVSFILSYDGSTGARHHGAPLPAELGLTRLAIAAGRSSQSTLRGLREQTVESLYLSPALVARIGGSAAVLRRLGAPASPAGRAEPRAAVSDQALSG